LGLEAGAALDQYARETFLEKELDILGSNGDSALPRIALFRDSNSQS
jgi:hypothetical protein